MLNQKQSHKKHPSLALWNMCMCVHLSNRHSEAPTLQNQSATVSRGLKSLHLVNIPTERNNPSETAFIIIHTQAHAVC